MVSHYSSTGRDDPEEASSSSRAYLTEPSPWEPDTFHFTIEWKELALPATAWERVERSWELPAPLTDRQQAETVARLLALAADGGRVYRVLDPAGTVLQVYLVKKYLSVLEPGQLTEKQETIPAGFEASALSEVQAR